MTSLFSTNFKYKFFRLLTFLFFPIIFINYHAHSESIYIDVSGKAGNSGINASNYNYRAYTGQNGQKGRNAGVAQKGQDAGKIDIRLDSESVSSGIISLTGYIISSENQQSQISLISDSNIILKANGGNGGNGGRGGNGQTGGDGRDGRDASAYFRGQNGEDGYRGGDAGRGTSGAKGGNGGEINISISQENAALLMLVDQRSVGGKGGNPGSHGLAGRGGRGGDGGDSFYWEECDNYYDDVGNWEEDCDTYSNSGGYDGRTGPSGRAQTSQLISGQYGKSGQLNINFDDDNKTYHSIYDLRLVSYSLRSEIDDNIFEPGEKIYVENLVVKNIGEAPTPKYTNIKLFLNDSEFALAEPHQLTLNISLNQNETFSFENNENFFFKIPTLKNNTAISSRFNKSEVLIPVAQMDQIFKNFNSFSSGIPFQITYPIEIKTLSAPTGITAGTSQKIILEIKNISNKDFGINDDLKRQIFYSIENQKSNLNENTDFSLLNSKGEQIDLTQGLLGAIENLKAGDSAILELDLMFSESANYFETIELAFGLNIDTINNPTEEEQFSVQNIQKKIASIHVSKAYRKTQGSDFLIITNNKTSRDSYLFWQQFATQLETTADIWDLSVHAALALTDNLERGTHLANDFKDKTIIFLANEFTSEISETPLETLSLLSKKDFLLALTKFNINFVIVGEKSNLSELYKLLYPSEGEIKLQLSNLNRLNFAINNYHLASDVLTNWAYSYTEADIQKNHTFRKPNSNDMKNIAKQIEKRLNNRDPNTHHYVFYDFDPKQSSNGIMGINKTWDYGTIEIRKSVAGTENTSVFYMTDDNNLNSKNFTDQNQILKSIFLSFSFQEKLNSFTKLMKSKELLDIDYIKLEALTEAIIYDLVHEQIQHRQTDWGWYGELNNLKAFSEIDLLMEKNSDVAKLTYIVDIYSSIYYLLFSYPNWQDHMKSILGASTQITANLKSERIINKGISNIFNTHFLPWVSTKKYFSRNHIMSMIRSDQRVLTQNTKNTRGKSKVEKRNLIVKNVLESMNKIIKGDQILHLDTENILTK